MTDVSIPSPLAERLLLGMVRTHSEDMWAAGWYMGIEFILWRQSRNDYEPGHCRVCDIRALAEAMGRWPVWFDDDDEPTTVPIAEFEALYERRERRRA